jgi:death-on-curing protein
LPKRARRYLGVDAVLAIHAEVLTAHGGSAGLRDRSLLESAVAAPQASFGGEALIRDTVEIAAAYLYYLCRNHPFVDGNKRTALATALVFLKANGRLKDLGQPEKRIDDWEALVLDVASSKLDRLEVARRLRVLLRRRR